MDTQPPADGRPGTPGPQAPPPDPGTDPAPDTRPGPGFFGAIRNLDVTRADDRWIAGVCAGLANRTGIDALVWRGIFGASILLGGLGFVLYGVAWALLPERRDGRIHVEELLAGRFDVAVLGAAAFTVIGLGRGGSPFWFWGGQGHWFGGIVDALAGLLWVAFVGGIIVAVVVSLNRRNAARRPGPAGPYGPDQRPPTGTQQGRTPYADQQYPGHTPPYAPQPYPTATYPAQAPAYTAYSAQTAPVQGHPPQAAAQQYPAAQPAPAPTSPVPATKPPKPRIHGPGAATVGTVVGLSLLTLAVLLAVDRAGDLDVPVLLTALGVAVVLAGIGIVVSGLRGRSSGVLGFLAIMGILVALPVGAATNTDWGWNDNGLHRFAGDLDLRPTTRQEAADGFTLGFGQAHVDLTDVPMSSQLLEVPVTVGAGDVTIVVPQDAAVTADVRLRAGQFTWDVDDSVQRADGISTDTRTFTDDASAAGSAQLDLRISVGAGDVTVIRENS